MPQKIEAALVRHTFRHAHVEEGTRDRLARAAVRNGALQLFYTPRNEGTARAVLARLLADLAIGRFEPDKRLEQWRAIYRVEGRLAHGIAPVAIGIEAFFYLLGHLLLRTPHRIVGGHDPAIVLCHIHERPHGRQEGVLGGEHLVLQSQGMEITYPACHAVIGDAANPGPHERSIEAEIDVGYARRRGKAALVLLAVAPERADVLQSSAYEADQVVSRHEVRRGVDIALGRQHGFVEAGRQHIDQIDIAGELVVLLFRNGGGDENAEMADGIVQGVDNGLPVGTDLIDALVEVEYPVQGLLRWRDVVRLGAEDDDRRSDVVQIDARSVGGRDPAR